MNITDFVIGYEDFKARYLEAANNIDSVTGFWNTYNQDPRSLIINRQFLLLRDRLFALLTACKRINSEAFSKIHKGHPYYFIGISSYLLDDYETAIYFFDAAVTQDLLFGADPITNPKPSTRFLMLDGDSIDQAARELTQYAQKKVERAIEYYQFEIEKDSNIAHFSLKDLRKDFIYYALTNKEKPGLRTLITAFITFCIEWDFRNEHFNYDIKSGTSEPFLLHLFRGCLLFESLLKNNPTVVPKGNTLNNLINDKCVLDKLKITPVEGKGDKKIFTLCDVFDALGIYKNTISEAVQITYISRNTLGHDLGWDLQITQDQYQKLYFIIVSSCLHLITCLWKGSSD